MLESGLCPWPGHGPGSLVHFTLFTIRVVGCPRPVWYGPLGWLLLGGPGWRELRGRGWAGPATPPPGRPGRRGALAGVSDAGRCPAALGRPMGVSESRLSGGLVAAHGRWWSQTGPARSGIAGADPSHLVVAGPGPAPGPQVPKPPRCSPGAATRTCVLSRSDRVRRSVSLLRGVGPHSHPRTESSRVGWGWPCPTCWLVALGALA